MGFWSQFFFKLQFDSFLGEISALDSRVCKILNTRVRLVLEYTCAPGPGAQNALKIGLVERRSWSQKIKKRKNVHFSYKEKLDVIWTSKSFSAFCRLIVPRPMDPPLGGVILNRYFSIGPTPTSNRKVKRLRKTPPRFSDPIVLELN